MTTWDQRADGTVYTPPLMARFIVAQTLASPAMRQALRDDSLSILDPACGEGVFLSAALQLARDGTDRGSSTTGCNDSLEAAERLLARFYGVDVDRQAVDRARHHLARLATPRGAATGFPSSALVRRLEHTIRVGNALIEPPAPGGCDQTLTPLSWKLAFPEVFTPPQSGFDVVIGNPPYVNIRLLTQRHGQSVKEYFRRHYQCAIGGFDLYVLFLERAFQLLRPDGCCGMIVPNKIAAMQYARLIRQQLAEQATVRRIVDVTSMGVFPRTGVYPYVIVWQKRKPAAGHRVSLATVQSVAELDGPITWRRALQREVITSGGIRLEAQLDVERRTSLVPLRQAARLHSGTTGFLAQRTALALREDSDTSGGACEFIVSGNIDRYCITPGDVRFMKCRFQRPVLPPDSPDISAGKWRLYRSPKIVIAGLTQRIEAAYDQQGMALGVQVYAATDLRDDHRYLLALLNSKLLSYLFRLRFQAKRLSGNYLAINKGQLGQLPIRLPPPTSGAAWQARCRIVDLVSRRMRLAEQPAIAGPNQQVDQIEQQIDDLVYALYDLSPDEVRRVEADFAT